MDDTTSPGTLSAGARHLRAEWSRWRQAEDLSDTYVAHHVLNDQYKLWRGNVLRTKSDVRQNITLMKRQQRQSQAMQMQRMAAMRQMSRGRGGGRGFGGFGMMGGSSPMVAYRTMQWAELDIKLGQKEFAPTDVTPNMLAVGRAQLRARRHRVVAAWLITLPLLWAGTWAMSVTAGLVATALGALMALAVAWSAGRNPKRRRPAPPTLLFVPPKPVAGVEAEPEPEPFAIREAGRTPRVAREAVRLALRKEGAKVAEVGLPRETEYGWRVPLVLESGTVAGIVRVLGDVATTLRVGPSRILARAADREDAAAVLLQILTTDPFANPLPYPSRSPLSSSIKDPVSLGLSIDGQTTPVVLAGQNVIVTGNPNAGKTSLVQALVEYVTSCSDAVVVDIDVAKRGLLSFTPLAARSARTSADAEVLLQELLDLATARVNSMPPTQRVWEPSPDGPAVLVVLDEFPQLSDRAKALALRLLQTGREARVTIILLTQNATKVALGQSFAEAFGVRVLMGCRSDDVPVVVGEDDAISKGWRPHVLVPSPREDDPADAGQFYCLTPHHREPILRYVSPLPPEDAERLAQERLAAGLPQLTAPQAPKQTEPTDTPTARSLLLDAFAAAGEPEVLPVAQLADYLAGHDPDAWGQFEDHPRRNMMVGKRFTELLRAEGLEIPTERFKGSIEGYGERPKVYRREVVRDALS